MSVFKALLKRELALALRQGGGLGAALAFLLAFLVLIPLSIGPDQATLSRLAPGLMWLALLLAVLLTTERIFQPDYDDGSLDLLSAAVLPLEAVCGLKALAHWLSVGLPLAVISAPLGILLNLEADRLPSLLISMFLGSLSLSAIAAIAGAITAGLRRGGLLVPLLALPLYVPVLIFGVAAATGDLGPTGNGPARIILVGLALLLGVLQPWASAAAIRAYFR